jgi:uncharacterized protein YjiS (DUF1127 family)
MTTLIKLLKKIIGQHHYASIDDHLLSDIGVSRVIVEYVNS